MTIPLSRRQFLTRFAATTALTLLAPQLKTTANTTTSKPPRLKPGDSAGLISPAGATFEQEKLEIVIDAVKGLGLKPRLAPHVLDRYGYLAGKDEERAADINQFFADPEINILLPVRGGWGCSRILPYLDYETIGNNPKILVGFSDVTSLILALNARSNLVTFHGPNGYSSWRTRQTESFRQVLFAGETATYSNQLASNDADRLMQVQNRTRTISSGKARGKLLGGNLSVLSGIIGSPYVPDWEGAILFLEDIGENIYRVDRMLTHLKLAGVLSQLSGFVFGQCTNCSTSSDYGGLTLEEVIRDHIKPLGIPAWSGAEIGHVENVVTLPLGLEVEIDADLATITMLEPAVI